MGLLTVLRKVRQKERELRVLMVYVGREGRGERGKNRRVFVLWCRPPPLCPPSHTHSGLDNAGKTTVTASLTGGDTSTTAPTVGFEIRTLLVSGRLADGGGGEAEASSSAAVASTHPPPPTTTTTRRVNIWDVGGQKTLRPFWRNYFESTDGLVWVVDAADRARLPHAARELSTLLSEARLAAAPLLVLANKQDVAGAASADEVAGALGLSGGGSDGAAPAAGARPWRVTSTSARAEGAAAGVASAFDWLLDAVAEAAWAGGREEEADGGES